MSSLTLWLDGADATSMSLTGSIINTWTDKSASAIVFTGEGSPTLVTGALNGKSVVNLVAASSQYLDGGTTAVWNSTSPGGAEVYILFQADNLTGGNNPGPFQLSTTSTNGVYVNYRLAGGMYISTPNNSNAPAPSFLSTPVNNAWYAIALTYNGSGQVIGNYMMSLNNVGQSISDGSASTLTVSNHNYIGLFNDGDTSRCIDGQIAEVLVYNSYGNATAVAAYLESKWGVP